MRGQGLKECSKYVSVVIGPGCHKSRRRNTLWLRLWQSKGVVLQEVGESMVHYARMLAHVSVVLGDVIDIGEPAGWCTTAEWVSRLRE